MTRASLIISMGLSSIFALGAVAQEEGGGHGFRGTSLGAVQQIEKETDKIMVDSLRRAATHGDELVPNEADTVEEELATGGFGAVSKWDQYCKAFGVKVFDPPLEIDMTNSVAESIKTPLESITLYLSTWYTGNKTLRNRYSDASMREADEKITVATIPRADLSRVVLLYTARKTWKGNSYMFVKYRRQHPTAPNDNCCWFGGLCLKKTTQGYMWTDDLAWSQIMVCPSTPWIYKTGTAMTDELKKTDLPESFYTIPIQNSMESQNK